jgi:hypothetical protein
MKTDESSILSVAAKTFLKPKCLIEPRSVKKAISYQ